MSFLGNITDGFEAAAERVSGSFEAPEMVVRRTELLRAAYQTARQLPVVEPKPPTETALPTHVIASDPVITSTPQAITDSSRDSSSSMSDPLRLDANDIRARLQQIEYPQLDPTSLSQLVDGGLN